MKILLLLLLFLTLQFYYYNLYPNVNEHKSIHQIESEYFKSLNLTTDKDYDNLNNFQKLENMINDTCKLNKIIFGWHPYWSGSKYKNYQWNLLTDISFFSYEVDAATGNAITTHNWETSDIIDIAHQNNVKVNLCVTLFADHKLFFDNKTAQLNLIDNLIYLIKLRNANGVNIDFEGVKSWMRDDFTNFMIELSTNMHKEIPNSKISLSVYAIDWNNVFDLQTLNQYVDLFCIMGYDYYWNGSSYAGPVSALYTMSSFDYNLSRSVTYYLSNGVDKNKLILGLPYYGRVWATQSDEIPSKTTNKGKSITYSSLKNDKTGIYNNPKWENNSFTPYYTFKTEIGWNQCFIDNAYSLGKRYDFVNQRNLAGIAIWALGYDDGYTELWDKIRAKFTNCPIYSCKDTIYDMGGPSNNYYNNENYQYTIKSNNDANIVLNFNSFNLRNSTDTLWIYNGIGTSNLINYYTGSNSPSTIYSTKNALTIKFFSDNNTTNQGWEAIWECSSLGIDYSKYYFKITNNIVYPIPSKNNLFINSTYRKKLLNIEVFNYLGRKLLSQEYFNDYIGISHLSSGIYILKLNYKYKSIITKFIK